MITIKKDSWHYKLYILVFEKPPKNLCDYAWGHSFLLFVALIALAICEGLGLKILIETGFVAPIAKEALMPILIWHIFYNTELNVLQSLINCSLGVAVAGGTVWLFYKFPIVLKTIAVVGGVGFLTFIVGMALGWMGMMTHLILQTQFSIFLNDPSVRHKPPPELVIPMVGKFLALGAGTLSLIVLSIYLLVKAAPFIERTVSRFCPSINIK